ncbi:MAG: zf-HC2 domain-containing protein [Clostridia bacterium]|nr:zf-HC2 domain-containing protein [Oscillospiraceae bacterium]MBQ3763314.1 zf-HC2 domain-containing protein [Clostridia bacterium]
MKCEEYLPLISGHLDGENSEIEERRLQEHLKTCESCRALLSEMERNEALLKESIVAPPADLTERIMREVPKEKQTASHRGKRWIPIAASGLAAAALLALVVLTNLPFLGGAGSKDAAMAENAPEYTSLTAVNPAEAAEGALSSDAMKMYAPEAAVVSETGSLQYGSGLDESSGLNAGALPPTEPLPRFAGRYVQTSPMLIVWNADGMQALSAFTPEELNEYAPFSANVVPSLYERFQAAIPLLRDFDRISPADGFGITVYTVPYETMIAAIDECVGVYENAIYYPAAITTPNACSVVLVDISE